MGGLTKTGKTWTAWTGGKPDYNWIGLEKPEGNRNPLRRRENNSKATAAHEKRQDGLYSSEDMKFKHGKNLDFFLETILEFFVDHGMDAICY